MMWIWIILGIFIFLGIVGALFGGEGEFTEMEVVPRNLIDKYFETNKENITDITGYKKGFLDTINTLSFKIQSNSIILENLKEAREMDRSEENYFNMLIDKKTKEIAKSKKQIENELKDDNDDEEVEILRNQLENLNNINWLYKQGMIDSFLYLLDKSFENISASFMWLASESENADPKHMGFYGKKYYFSKKSFETLPGYRLGCKCGMVISPKGHRKS